MSQIITLYYTKIKLFTYEKRGLFLRVNEASIKNYHKNQANKNSEKQVVEDEKRLDSVLENEEDDDIQQHILSTPNKSNLVLEESKNGNIKSWVNYLEEMINTSINQNNNGDENNNSIEIENNELHDSLNNEDNEKQYEIPINKNNQDSDEDKEEHQCINKNGIMTFDYNNPIHRFAEANKDLELIAMEQEDRASKIYEDAIHQRKFKQKDAVVPLKHTILATAAFFNTSVWENWTVQDPAKESFTKYMANTRPLDLSKIKYRVLWSKEKVAKEKEEKKRLKEKAKLDKRNKFINNLENILDNNNWNKSIFKSKNILSNEYKSKPDKPIEYAISNDLASVMSVELVQNITGRLYPSKADIIYQKVLFHFSKMKEKLVDYIKDIQIPNIRDYIPDYEKLYKDSSKINEIKESK